MALAEADKRLDASRAEAKAKALGYKAVALLLAKMQQVKGVEECLCNGAVCSVLTQCAHTPSHHKKRRLNLHQGSVS